MSEELKTLTGEGEPGFGAMPEAGDGSEGKERARWLEVRRRIERRQDLKRLRELLEDPDFEELD